MTKAHNPSQEDSQEKSPDQDQPVDMTVDLDAIASRENESNPSTKRAEVVTSIDISDVSGFGQTMDLTPANSSIENGTLDLEDASDQTIDLSDPPGGYADGTRMVSPSMAPFQGKVFGSSSRLGADGTSSASEVPEDGTKIVGGDPGGDHGGQDYTMDIDSASSNSSSSSLAGRSLAEDGTMLLSDSQAASKSGSQPGSSSIDGKSSYDQTMDLSESASDSKNGSEVKSLVTGNPTGQSIRTGGPTNSKSIADSKQYLQAERAKASDAIYQRLTDRRISYTVDWNDDTADYQIKTKNDAKTGKIDLHILGKGGMGLVYLATQNSVKRSVALKVIRKDKQNDTFVKQFFYEAEITAGLEHPNITPVYELGRTKEGVCFYSMKYIQGNPWEKKIRDYSIDENLEIFDKLCDAIAFAHSKGILHMDIKPDNVQLGEFGEVYAVDWGVASDLKRPESIRCAGTWQWISPEVARGDKSKIGKGSDIYLLGGILFQIVTGHHPRLPKDASEKMGQAAMAKAAQNNVIQPTDCKDPMVAVALRALETDPKDRYAKVDDLQTAIHAIQKERANIKSSQELTQKSVLLGAEAIEQGDYDRFNRSLFGLKDAIELWDENPDATIELNKVRLAYGQCAFEKGDYDLALQTLDRSEAQEDELYQKAELAQTAVKLRVQRFRLLRNVFIASLLVGSGIVGFLWQQAETEKKNAISSEQKAKQAEWEAGLLACQAQASEADEIVAKKEKEVQRLAAVRSKSLAELQLAKTQLTEITSKLGLARSRINESNPTGAYGLLGSIQEQLDSLKKQKNESRNAQDPRVEGADDHALITQLPDPDNWARNRIMLLANEDLMGVNLKTQAQFDPETSAVAMDGSQTGLLVANRNGEIYRVDFDGNKVGSPLQLGGKELWSQSHVKAVRRIVPSPDGTKLYLSLERDIQQGADKAPVLVVDLQTQNLSLYDKEIPKAVKLLALSPTSRHIATTLPSYLWFTKNEPGSKGNTVPTKEDTIQIQWLSDELLLALIKNKGSYYLELIAPFAGNSQDGLRPQAVEYLAPLKDEVIRFALLDSQMPDVVLGFNRESLFSKNDRNEIALDAKKVDEQFAEILQSLHFVFGQVDGSLIQARLKLPTEDKTNPSDSIASGLWEFVDDLPLVSNHVHAIEEILVESAANVDSTSNAPASRRMITRAAQEQSVQVWTLTESKTSKQSVSDQMGQKLQSLRISHLHSLTAGPLKEDPEDKSILFAKFDRNGDVILINSEFTATRLNVSEQIERNRIAFEEPFVVADAFEESTAKWLFSSSGNKNILSVDGYGVAALYQPGKTQQQKQVDFGKAESALSFRQFLIDPQSSDELVKVKQLQNDFQYWGHSPFAKIQHVAFSPDGKTALSLATVDGKNAVYGTPRNTEERSESMTFSEVCLWDVENGQWLDRIAFEPQKSLGWLSAIDDHRFVFGNTESLVILERHSSSLLSQEHASKAVHFCVRNPVHPVQVYFRADAGEGVCWIGSISTDSTKDNSKSKWLDLESNRLVVIPKPIAGCWSHDGNRLYVLDVQGNIKRYDFDPVRAVLSSSLEKDSPNRLVKIEALEFIKPISLTNPQAICMGIANSMVGENGWSDEIYIRAIGQPQNNQQSAKPSKPIHAIFRQKDSPEWLLDAQLSKAEEDFQGRIDRLFELIDTNKVAYKDENYSEFEHELNQVTCDAKGQLLILQYSRAALFLSIQDGQDPRWYRLDRDFSDVKSFDLSPDAKTLAMRDSNGLRFYRVGQKPDNQGFEIEPIDSPLPKSDRVQHFAWDPQEDSKSQENAMRFACTLDDNSVLYVHNGQVIDLGKICSMQAKGEDDSEEKSLDQLQVRNVQCIWFFKEQLADYTVEPISKKTLRYLALQTVLDTGKPGDIRFIQLPDEDSLAIAQPAGSNKRSLTRCVDLNLGQSFIKIVPNEHGGIIATGDTNGDVAVFLVSPYWDTANQVFDANPERDSQIEGLFFAEQGDTLVVSNANNHLFGIRTKPATPQATTPSQ